MTTVDDVVEAFNAIERAREHYRATLRACLAEGDRGTQAEISRRLGRSRETLRLDRSASQPESQHG